MLDENDILEDMRKRNEMAQRDEARFRALVRDFKEVFGTPAGQRVFEHLVDRCHVFHTTYTGNSLGMFKEGERNIGLYLMAMRGMATVRDLDDIMKRREADGLFGED